MLWFFFLQLFAKYYSKPVGSTFWIIPWTCPFLLTEFDPCSYLLSSVKGKKEPTSIKIRPRRGSAVNLVRKLPWQMYWAFILNNQRATNVPDNMVTVHKWMLTGCTRMCSSWVIHRTSGRLNTLYFVSLWFIWTFYFINEYAAPCSGKLVRFTDSFCPICNKSPRNTFFFAIIFINLKSILFFFFSWKLPDASSVSSFWKWSLGSISKMKFQDMFILIPMVTHPLEECIFGRCFFCINLSNNFQKKSLFLKYGIIMHRSQEF